MKMTFFILAFQFLFIRKKRELNFYSHINPLYCSISKPYYSFVCCLVQNSFKMAAFADILSVEAVRELASAKPHAKRSFKYSSDRISEPERL